MTEVPDASPRSLLLSVPLVLAVAVGWAWALDAWLATPLWRAAAAGAAGWTAALFLRGPVALAARRAPPERGRTWLVAASGPLEEAMRLVVLLGAGRWFRAALWIGWGWATAEVAFTVLNALVLARLLARDDEKGRRVREQLAQQGRLPGGAPILGALERVSATALHVGFTLVLAVEPWLVVVTAAVHSGTNVMALRWRRSPLRTEAVITAMGTVVFLGGLFLFGRLT